MKILVTVCRILVGLLFIFSGFIKANDPLGFSYKLDEYFEIFHLAFLTPITVYLAMFICVFEIVLGVMVLFGINMNVSSWLLLLMIIFFTWLTGYSAFTGKVSDCGCFGDAIKLTPQQSFYKDLVLLFLILIIFIYRDQVVPLFGRTVSNLIIILSLLLCTGFTVYSYQHLPQIDFRAYKPGNNIREQMTIPPGALQDSFTTQLTYKNLSSGEKKDFTLATLPWRDSMWMKAWKFDTSKTVLVREGVHPKITDFKIWNNQNQDITEQILNTPGYIFWVVAYDVPHTNEEAFDKINELAKQSEQNKISFIGLTSSPYEITDPFRHDVNASFPFYYSDGTVLKTIIRSNPGLVLLKDATVLAQWHYNDIPTFEDVKAKYIH